MWIDLLMCFASDSPTQLVGGARHAVHLVGERLWGWWELLGTEVKTTNAYVRRYPLTPDLLALMTKTQRCYLQTEFMLYAGMREMIQF